MDWQEETVRWKTQTSI